MSVTLVSTDGHVTAVTEAGAVVGVWTYGEPVGLPHGWWASDQRPLNAGHPGETFDYMEWLFAVSGFPKVYIVSEQSGAAYFLTRDETPRLGYAILGPDGKPGFDYDGNSGLAADTEGEFEDEQNAAEAALLAFVAAVPALVSAL